VSATRLEGRPIAVARQQEIAAQVEALRASGCQPRLAVVMATQDEAGLSYFRSKKRLAEKLGIVVDAVRPPEETTGGLASCVEDLAADPGVHGIMIETPLPDGIDLEALRGRLPAGKDVDGAGIESLGRLLAGRSGFAPATAEAVIALLDGHGIPLAGKRVAVIGRSLVVGRPLSLLLLSRNATVTVCHSKTIDLPAHTRAADIVVVAVGRAGFLTGDLVGKDVVVVDVGTNWNGEKLVGDTDFESVSGVAAALSPVPGGVGPLTTTLLMEHVVRAAAQRNA